ncbi:hypothetical protein [Achromobacter sp. ESBL13]|uniref:hypothetical protein n=1 Tax=Achromobacter sp. ESBL13 TaxID=3077328 RepID=UPI002FC83B2A
MTENNAAQPGRGVNPYSMADALYKAGYQDARKERDYDPRGTEEWQTVVEALSKLRAEGVQAGDERVRAALAALLGQWDKYKSSEYQNQEDAYNRLDKYARPLWKEARAALASAPVAEEAAQAARWRWILPHLEIENDNGDEMGRWHSAISLKGPRDEPPRNGDFSPESPRESKTDA